LIKQARAFSVGVLVATQNPKLQTDADCARVLDGLASTRMNGRTTAELGKVVKNLAPRWFLLRDVHTRAGTILLQPRWAMSLLRGPMTRTEIQQALEMRRKAVPNRSRVPVPKPSVVEDAAVTPVN
jgi:hypothetical protein